jgi:hypothetical protein
MPFSKSIILIPVCITVPKAFLEVNKAGEHPAIIDPSDPNNYRGITITNSLGKLFNRILDNRLTKFLDKHHVINDSQMGFTKKANGIKKDCPLLSISLLILSRPVDLLLFISLMTELISAGVYKKS